MNKVKSKNGIDVSIITVNYNGYKDTCQMIESVKKHIKSVSYEIIVIDNASFKDEATMIYKKHPSIVIMRSDTNKGFAGGNNMGAYISRGKYLFFLNNDTIIKNDDFHFLIETLESDKKIGGVSPMICYADNGLIQYAGFTPMTRYTLRNHSIGNGQPISEEYQKQGIVPFLHGAAMMVKKKAYEQIGAMPEMYFLYYEEFDFCSSLNNKGYKLYYDPRCVIFHKESQSTGKNSPLQTYYLTRNRMLFAYRNRSKSEVWLILLYLTLIVAPKDCLKYLFKRQYILIKATIYGVIDYYKLKYKEKNAVPFHHTYR